MYELRYGGIRQWRPADGKIRSIGLSNWYVDELEAFLPQISITPALIQNEIHPYYQEKMCIRDRVGSAEEKSREIIDEALKTAETKLSLIHI